MFFTRVIKVLLVVIVAFAFASVATAFAASNTFPSGAGSAGDGSSAISGYTITNVHYTLSATDPSNIDTVTFTLSQAAASVSIQLDGTNWVTCSVSGGTSVTCPGSGTTGLTALDAANLRVVAAQ